MIVQLFRSNSESRAASDGGACCVGPGWGGRVGPGWEDMRVDASMRQGCAQRRRVAAQQRAAGHRKAQDIRRRAAVRSQLPLITAAHPFVTTAY